MNGNAPPLADALRVAAAAWHGLRGGNSLDRALAEAMDGFAAPLSSPAHPRLAAAAKDIAYGATRQLALIEAMLEKLVHRAPEPAVSALLAVALGQLLAPRQAAYVVVDQAVQAPRRWPAPARRPASSTPCCAMRSGGCRRCALNWSASRASPSMRRAGGSTACASEPAHFARILQLQRQAPPLVLRVNRRRSSVEAYLQRLHGEGIEASRVGASAVWLHTPLPVADIPGFGAGDVSVQDAGAQLAVELLQSKTACACSTPAPRPASRPRNWPRSPMTSLSTRSKSTPRVASGSRRTCAARGRASTRSSACTSPTRRSRSTTPSSAISESCSTRLAPPPASCAGTRTSPGYAGRLMLCN